MICHHTDYGAGRQEWTTFHGKIPILQSPNRRPEVNHSSRGNRVAHAIDDFVTDNANNNDEPTADMPRVSLLMELTDGLGVLQDVLKYFWKYDVNIGRIESRPAFLSPNGEKKFDFFIDFYGTLQHPSVQKLMDDLHPIAEKLLVLDEKSVKWFPRHGSELDLIAHRTLDAGDELKSDHPGFTDMEYRRRREELTSAAKSYSWDSTIDHTEYSNQEVATWTAIWDKMEPLWDEYACKEYKAALNLMKENCGYDRNSIPQQQDISNFLLQHTGFRMRPVSGLLSSRDFLNGLAFRVFFSTQYIRHHSKPLYTPEPDVCHELLGHAPMFADRDFADFSQEIGLASLGASDADIEKLAHCYWHSVEFGLCEEEGGALKAYGAGLLSSFGELEYACGGGEGRDTTANNDETQGLDKPELRDWDPAEAAMQTFPITTYQPMYFVARSLADATQRMRRYCEDLPRPFYALHNAQTGSIHIDRPIRRSAFHEAD
eukprot:CAMPEP_0119557658 /NCGR_PEP_ID=MMETSP1352-20130426/9261_1 /TAXON_ID=265584 /ORGANISM="Stauroneis constricta, Strain CCMP1120" /LENGTH=486 /DNA_ID=CAMNT_0007604797 /DNA_START=223 /DNA_END=1683 /DNA_ORIENTATION=-